MSQTLRHTMHTYDAATLQKQTNGLREGLSRRIEELLLPLIRGARRICLIDPPGHPNVGDSMILLGELDFLARYFPSAKLSFFDVDSYSPDADRLIERADILLIHGGGNFGDIWPHHHALRMRILRRFAHKRTIQFPQSIHFSSAAALAETVKVIAAHRAFTLLARDRRSFAFAQEKLPCAALLSPDMAFAMHPIRRRLPVVDLFCLFRTDKEAVIDRTAILSVLKRTGRSVEVRDWLDKTHTPAAWLDRRIRHRTRRNPSVTFPLQGAMLWLRRHYAMLRLLHGIKLLSRGDIVVADRLHAHILCCLLGIRHFAFDSFDGKISAFYETWTQEFSGAQLVFAAAELAALI